ncbi:MAG TPA: bifunctional phosphoribosylaminoimidazolecarboxamide formyltransferase/IMP cyclohydrolase [Candidatus Paceibacterota bacterium]|nr:bifunctional phosphoribosylaminoimidazolecarboxamide formyltransferase/IMP cyclohydrolase [Candidatus Paceibacterota bacterium]
MNKKIKTALISVFHKDNLEDIIKLLHKHKVKIISTGGTAEFIKKLNVPVVTVESITGFPSVFGGRVKTLQPQIFGGILNRRDNKEDQAEKAKYKIEDIDLVIVDLYPFEETLASEASDDEIIEKIDIGGISLIRAGAKNFNDVVIVPSKNQYLKLREILERGNETTLEERKEFAGNAFEVSSSYDLAIHGYFQGAKLRYGENPHQQGKFVGQMENIFDIKQGKELSYNNLLDVDAAIRLIGDFSMPAFAILKHTNACGIAANGNTLDLCKSALSSDPISAFGGILIANNKVDEDVAKFLIEEKKLFFEIIIAPSFGNEALEIFKKKPDIRVLEMKDVKLSTTMVRTCLNGLLVEDSDKQVDNENNMAVATKRAPMEQEKKDLLIAAIAVKHLKSNCVAIVKNGHMLTMGAGQVSRVDALKNALEKAKGFGLDVTGGVMASEAFFPFPDCVEIAGNAGITAVIQPGGSKNDQKSIDKADELNMAMVMTGFRHFKH